MINSGRIYQLKFTFYYKKYENFKIGYLMVWQLVLLDKINLRLTNLGKFLFNFKKIIFI